MEGNTAVWSTKVVSGSGQKLPLEQDELGDVGGERRVNCLL